MSARLAEVDCRLPRHVRVSGPRLTFAYARCAEVDCVVSGAGVGSSCGEPACPRCGSGGSNLSVVERPSVPSAEVRCSCGHVWIRERVARRPRLALAEHAAR